MLAKYFYVLLVGSR